MLNVHKNTGYSISILGNSNKILSSTQENLASLAPGTLIKIGESDLLYPVQSSRNIYYNKNFEVINGRQIKINEDTETYIQREDLIKIIYDEYELEYLFDVENPGQYYKVGDVLNIKGGELSIDIRDGMGQPTKFVVDEIGEAGAIKKLSLKDKGRYIKIPEGKIEVWGGTGQDCILNLKYKMIDNKNIEEKTVKNVEFKEGYTLLSLDYSLPQNIKNGKLSLEKSELTLAIQYLGKTILNSPYKIIKDFTQVLGLPLTVKNNQEFHLVFNQAMQIIDRLGAEVKELRKLLDKK
jgi:hypothetical protein